MLVVKLTLWVVLSSVQQVYSDPQNCSTSASITGGHVTYSEGGREGSELTYHCGPGQYPFPVSVRTCRSNGQWTTMRLSNGRPITRAVCKDVMCPAQLQLDNGHFWPRDQWFRVGVVQSFSCVEGFMLHGSAHRNCTITGEWTGTTPVCWNYDNDCDDPGTPPGAQSQRLSGHFFIGDRVSFTCQRGLELLGSAHRECLEHREWSGSAPRCQSSYMFDSPTKAAAAMTGSLAGVMDVLSPEFIKEKGANLQRAIVTSKGSRLNVFILLDTSGSITKEDFESSKSAAIALIRKLATYEVQIRYHVLSFATEVINIVDIIRDELIRSHEDYVISNLQSFDRNRHGSKTGTNLYAALNAVNEKISIFKTREKKHFNETQNIIILQTDGYSNVGNKSTLALNKIRGTLGYDNTPIEHTHERLLDVYVFGIGSKVKKNELNSLASKKRDEKHLFILKDYSDLGEVFNNIISDKSVTLCGVAQEDVPDDSRFYPYPWHVTFSGSTTDLTCSGSIVSPNWVLTAAHCFGRKASDEIPQKLIRYGGERFDEKKTVMSKRVIMHPNYNVEALRQRNVQEFYDYDVALVEVEKPIPLSWQARPICLPCTVPANRAMKKVNNYTMCEQHRKELIPHTPTSISFIHKGASGFERKESHIHTGDQRSHCVEGARQTLGSETDVTLEEYVPERLFCAGGTADKQDSITCKGDSGGSVFLHKRKRFFQVGVVSWGTHNCKSSNSPQQSARDFHIDVFKIMTWLKKYLGNDIQFFSDVN